MCLQELKLKRFKWHRRRLSLDEYKAKMHDKDCDPNGNEKKDSKLELAYKTASEIRQFEIGLFWRRATFFWAFIAAIYTAYFNVLVKIYPCGRMEQPPYQHGKIPLLILSGLGLFFCFSWLLSSKGSKHWQENWENHLDLLEDEVTGPLYKIYEAGKSYSESRLTIAAGWVMTICSYSLLMFEFSCFVQNCLAKKGLLSFFVVLCFALLVVILLSIFSMLMRGNQASSGTVEFQIKEYEGLNE